jgi:hypothetical protein
MNQYYDYHGGCDMILVKNSLIEIHIRTKINQVGLYIWSVITGVAIKIGNDVLEMQEMPSTYFVNTVPSLLPPAVVGGNPVSAYGPNGFAINLGVGQLIRVSSYGYGMTVEIVGHVTTFYDSKGMCGSWTSNGFIGRNGITTLPNALDFAAEWEVGLGDPQLFLTSALHQCNVARRSLVKRQSPDRVLEELANTECAYIQNVQIRNNCIFDIVVAGDIGYAQQKAYLAPEEVKEVCQAVSTDCEGKGGKCIWRCDTKDYDCLPKLCKYVDGVQTNITGQLENATYVEGCSCAVPKSPVKTLSPRRPIGRPRPRQRPRPSSRPRPRPRQRPCPRRRPRRVPRKA